MPQSWFHRSFLVKILRFLKKDKNWSKIRPSFDQYEGYIDNKQYLRIDRSTFIKLSKSQCYYCSETVSLVGSSRRQVQIITIGSRLPFYKKLLFFYRDKQIFIQRESVSREIWKRKNNSQGILAFFSNEKDRITHVGIIVNNRELIHALGKIKVDSLDDIGIYNWGLKTYTHGLRSIKKIF